MALDDDDRKEIAGLINTGLGLEEGKTLADVLGATVNDGINKYDARVTREAKTASEKMDATLKGLADGLEGLKTQPPKDPPVIDGLTDDQLKKLDAPTRQLIANLNLQQKELGEKFERSEAERVKQDAAAKLAGEQQDAVTLRNTVRDTLLDKEKVGADYDPADIDLFVGSLIENVQRNDKGHYEFRVGIDTITKEPVYKSLADGLKGISTGATAKRFQRAVGGTPPGGMPKGGPGGGGEKITGAQLADMSPAEVRKASDAGLIDFNA